MILDALILSFIVAIIRRGRFGNLSDIPLKKWYLFVLPFVLASIVAIIVQMGYGEQFITYLRAINILEYVILLYAIAVNLHIRDMKTIGLGTLLNAIVVTANGGVMPVSAKALKQAGLDYLLKPGQFNWDIRHTLIDASTRLSFLGDIIPKPGIGKVMPEVASIGDIIIAVGVFMLVQYFMCQSKPAK